MGPGYYVQCVKSQKIRIQNEVYFYQHAFCTLLHSSQIHTIYKKMPTQQHGHKANKQSVLHLLISLSCKCEPGFQAVNVRKKISPMQK